MKKLSILALFTSFLFSEVNAQLIKVDQAVYGMDCAPCAYGLERGLRKMEGIEKVVVSLNKGEASLTLASENKLTLGAIQEAVKKNGFSARSAEVVLIGKLSETGGDWFIKINEETFRITEGLDGNLKDLKPGELKIRGVVADKADNLVDTKWEITVTEIL